jgi:hypothetical protein
MVGPCRPQRLHKRLNKRLDKRLADAARSAFPGRGLTLMEIP